MIKGLESHTQLEKRECRRIKYHDKVIVPLYYSACAIDNYISGCDYYTLFNLDDLIFGFVCYVGWFYFDQLKLKLLYEKYISGQV